MNIYALHQSSKRCTCLHLFNTGAWTSHSLVGLVLYVYILKTQQYFDITHRQSCVNLGVSSSWVTLLPYVREQPGLFWLLGFFLLDPFAQACPIFTTSKLLLFSPLGRCEEHASLSPFLCAVHVCYEEQSGARLSTFRHRISTINADVPSGPSMLSTC